MDNLPLQRLTVVLEHFDAGLLKRNNLNVNSVLSQQIA